MTPIVPAESNDGASATGTVCRGGKTKRKTTMKDPSTSDDAIQCLRTGYWANGGSRVD